jgi:hypothetical protein
MGSPIHIDGQALVIDEQARREYEAGIRNPQEVICRSVTYH